MHNLQDDPKNKNKAISHGFFLAIATSIAEPATILPLIVTHFGGSSILVGIFASLLRGGAILVQMIAAFYAQSFSNVLTFIRRVFLTRFLAWFSIGLCINIFGTDFPHLTLILIGIGLFIFSFSAGFGAIYFNELLGKMFSNRYRGKVMAQRQFFAGFGAIMSGAVAGWVLNNFEAPHSFGYLFIISSFLMAIGFLSFSSVSEPEKTNTGLKEKNFFKFLINSFGLLKTDTALKYQITTFLLSYIHLLSLPFIILEIKEKIHLDGTAIGMFISAQMLGAMLSNIAWGNLSQKGFNKLIIQICTLLLVVIFISLLFIETSILYTIVFFFLGACMDGYRLGFTNLLLIIAPEDKRPVYVALQANIGSFGIFFSILGGFILKYSSYSSLYMITAMVLVVNFLLTFKLKDER